MFSGKTILERINSREYKLRSTLIFENENYIVTISDGLLTDGASIPKLFWSIIGSPFCGKYVGSALIHDALYSSHIISKEESDLLFLDMMRENGVNEIKIALIYEAVKLFGNSSYNDVTEDEINEARKYIKLEKKNV